VHIIRDPALGGRELQKMGGFVCKDDSVTVWGPERVEGTVMTFPEDKERRSPTTRFATPSTSMLRS
jgi:hypothetical protein